MMTKQDVKDIIRNLTIDIYQHTEFGPREQIEVELRLNGGLIDKSSCDLPLCDNVKG
jgi:hypothetical protein